eukprot:SAG22_NODE_1146_length_5374_cov_7.602654_2_plen_590_part_00
MRRRRLPPRLFPVALFLACSAAVNVGVGQWVDSQRDPLGRPTCRCIDPRLPEHSLSGLCDGSSRAAGTGGGGGCYPDTYGSSGCGRHDANVTTECIVPSSSAGGGCRLLNGTAVDCDDNSAVWCAAEFCWVDPAQCSGGIASQPSKFFPAARWQPGPAGPGARPLPLPLHYSYETCGAVNAFDAVGFDVFRLGALFPMFKFSGQLDAAGVQRLHGFLLAVREIKDKADGVADGLLLGTTLALAAADSKRDIKTAFFGALQICDRAFADAGVHAFVGAASSGPTMNAALISTEFGTPQISFSATSADLSDSERFPLFARMVSSKALSFHCASTVFLSKTVPLLAVCLSVCLCFVLQPPSDAFQSKAMVDLVRHFGWGAVSTVSSGGGYGLAGMEGFKREARKIGLAVSASHTFQGTDSGKALDDVQYAASRREISRAIAGDGHNIIVYFGPGADAFALLEAAAEFGAAGEASRFVWILPDAVASNSPPAGFDTSLLLGCYTLIVQIPRTPEYRGFVRRWRAQPATGRLSASDLTSNVPPPAVDADCSAVTDDQPAGSEPYPLYWQWQDGVQLCTGINYSTFAPDGSDINS